MYLASICSGKNISQRVRCASVSMLPQSCNITQLLEKYYEDMCMYIYNSRNTTKETNEYFFMGNMAYRHM